jgi:predicted RNase H-like HicB family nuclease
MFHTETLTMPRRTHSIMNMDYRVVLIRSEEGFSVSCPSLPGCHSQGATLDEALENIKSAIREWLDAESEDASGLSVLERIVTV